MYFVHLAMSTVAQNLFMPSINSSFRCGFTSLLINSLSSCQRFSIGFKSGDSGTVFHQLMLLASKKNSGNPGCVLWIIILHTYANNMGKRDLNYPQIYAHQDTPGSHCHDNGIYQIYTPML